MDLCRFCAGPICTGPVWKPLILLCSSAGTQLKKECCIGSFSNGTDLVQNKNSLGIKLIQTRWIVNREPERRLLSIELLRTKAMSSEELHEETTYTNNLSAFSYHVKYGRDVHRGLYEYSNVMFISYMGVFYIVCNHGNHRNAKQDAARVQI